MNGNNRDIARVIQARQMLRDGTARLIRRDATLSLNEAAQAYGFSSTPLSRLERGLLSPQPATALRIDQMLHELRTLSRVHPEVKDEERGSDEGRRAED